MGRPGVDTRLLAILLCGGLILVLSLGIRQTLGLFVAPMATALGWSTSTLAFAIGLQNLCWGLAQPLASGLADRFGTGRVLIGGGVAYVAGLLLATHPATPIELQATMGVLVGIGIAATSFPVVLGAVARAVPEGRRSSALGLAAAGGSLGQFLMVPVAQGALELWDWVGALAALAALAGLMVPLAAGLATGPARAEAGLPAPGLGAAVAEALGHGGYWLVMAGFFVCGFHVAFVLAHMPAFLARQGLPDEWAAVSLGLIGFFNIPGTYLAGWLGARFSKKYLLTGIYLIRAGLFSMFLVLPVNPVTIVAFSLGVGTLWLGTVPLTSGLVGQIFGPRYLGTLFGITFMSHQVGAFIGAWSAGYLLDHTGSYQAAWAVSVLLALISAGLHLPIADRPLRRAEVGT